jgi:BatD DUF11 like domain
MMRSFLLYFLLLASSLSGAQAQEITFTANVDRNVMAVGERLRLTLTLTNGDGNITPPNMGGLAVVGGPSQNRSYSFVNGVQSRTTSVSWMLGAGAPGTYTIGEASVRIGNGVIKTDPITITVTKDAANKGSSANVAPNPGQNADLFASIRLSKEKVFVGEQLVATYTLYSRYANLQLGDTKMPVVNGFWAKEVPAGSVEWENDLVTINGLSYRVAVLKRQVLFPQRAGDLSVDAMELQCTVNQGFFNRGNTLTVRSNTAKVKVLPLPTAPPADFSGASGDLDMRVTTDLNEVKENDPIELTIQVSGRANLELLTAPPITFPSDLETYEPKVVDNISVGAQGMSGSRTFQYLIIPRHTGSYEIGPITMSYFDVTTRSFKSLGGQVFNITVERGDGTTGPSAGARPSQKNVELLDADIRYIRTTHEDLLPAGQYLFGSLPWLAGMAAPVLAFGLFTVWNNKRRKQMGDAVGQRMRGANRVAKQRLRQAEAAMRSNDRDVFYASLGKALEGYMADRFALGVAEVNEDNVREKLRDVDSGKSAWAYVNLLKVCQMARFAPVEEKPREQLYAEAEALLGTIEAHLRA